MQDRESGRTVDRTRATKTALLMTQPRRCWLMSRTSWTAYTEIPATIEPKMRTAPGTLTALKIVKFTRDHTRRYRAAPRNELATVNTIDQLNRIDGIFLELAPYRATAMGSPSAVRYAANWMDV